MRNLTVCILLFLANISFSQNYFKGEKTYCKITDAEVKRLYDLGLLSLMFPDKIDLTTHIFKELIIKDNSFCDAYFFCGYALRLQNRLDDAFVFMRAADSIANHRSIEFKINLAAVCVQMGQIEYARKKYIEVSKYFPRSPEGYYGIALTSTFKGDYANGIANINIAMKKYRTSESKMGDEVYLLKAILLTLNEQYADSFEYFRKAKSTYEESDDFNLYYSLSLLKTSKSTEDLKMKRKARKHFEKIKNMDRIPTEIRNELVF